MPSVNGQEKETFRRILESAASEFARHGFAATRIRDIVDAAGVNLAAVNYHFGGKEGLYRATLALLARRTQDEVPREATEVRRLPPEDQLRIFTHVMLSRFLAGAQAAPMARILAHELLDPTPAFDELMRDVAGPQFDRLSDIIARLLGPRASADDVALASISVIGQWASYLFGRAAIERRHPDLLRAPSAIDRLARQIGDFCLAGLRARRLEIESAAAAASPGRVIARKSERAVAARPGAPSLRRVAGNKSGEG
jgi:AcrR family transcriptional regulator